jgi:orotidine-5'-phosphate decarboxylase
VWCRSSNAGAADLQDLDVRRNGEAAAPLYEVLAALLTRWDRNRNLAFVIGATYPQQLARMRTLHPEMTFLLPGIGSQGGEVEATVRAGIDKHGGGILVAASRQVLYAAAGGDFAAAARQAALALRDEINRYRVLAEAGSGE